MTDFFNFFCVCSQLKWSPSWLHSTLALCPMKTWGSKCYPFNKSIGAVIFTVWTSHFFIWYFSVQYFSVLYLVFFQLCTQLLSGGNLEFCPNPEYSQLITLKCLFLIQSSPFEYNLCNFIWFIWNDYKNSFMSIIVLFNWGWYWISKGKSNAILFRENWYSNLITLLIITL